MMNPIEILFNTWCDGDVAYLARLDGADLIDRLESNGDYLLSAVYRGLHVEDPLDSSETFGKDAAILIIGSYIEELRKLQERLSA